MGLGSVIAILFLHPNIKLSLNDIDIHLVFIKNWHYSMTTMISFQYKLLWKYREVDFIGAPPHCVQLWECSLTYTFFHVFSNQIFISKASPFCCVSIEFHPIDFFIQGLGILPINIISDQ